MKLFHAEKPPVYRLTANTYRHFGHLRIAGIVILVFFILLIASAGVFIYLTVYKTLGQITVDDIVTRGVGVEVIDFPGLEKVEAAWNLKHASTTPVITRDPFYPQNTSPISPATIAPAPNLLIRDITESSL